MTVPFRSVRDLGIAVIVLLGAQIGLLALRGIAYFMRIGVLERIQAGGSVTKNEADASDGFVAGTAGLWLMAFAASVIVWLIWQYRAQANARALTEGGTQFSPGWAVGWWFVPFANLGMPFQTVRELWKASVGGTAWKAAATWPVIGWWWASWIVFNLSGVFSGTGDTSDVVTLIRDDRLRMASTTLGIASAALAIWIVRSVMTRQETAFGRAVTAPQMPPAPHPVPPPPVI